MLDLALRFGPFGNGFNPVGRGMSVRRLLQAPHGVDLGALQPVFPERLRTKDRTVRLAPQNYLNDVTRLESTLEGMATPPAIEADGAEAGAPLSLIGRRELRSNNSWMHNAERLMRGKPRCTLLMHPGDAAARHLRDGALVRVWSRTGEVEVLVEVSDEVMPGVVSLPHGWGHGGPGVRLRVAAKHAGVSINDLTDEQRIDTLCGNAAFSGVPVRVELAR